MMKLTEVFDSFREKKVLIIGDVMIDSYVFGAKKELDNIPSPILEVNRKEKRLGGAANVALNIQALGATPILCSVVGDDRNGQIFESLLDQQGLPNKGIIRSQSRITTNKLRVLSGSNQLIRIDSEDTHPLIELDKKALFNHILDLIKECDVIIFEDYDKGTIYSEIISETIRIAKESSIPIVVDPRQQNFESYKGVNLFKPGVQEIEDKLGYSIDKKDVSSVKKAFEELNDFIGADSYLLSMDNGEVFYLSEDYFLALPAINSGIPDMSGVGNALISVGGFGVVEGLEEEVIAALASVTVGIISQYTGVKPIDRDKLLKEASKNEILKKYF